MCEACGGVQWESVGVFLDNPKNVFFHRPFRSTKKQKVWIVSFGWDENRLKSILFQSSFEEFLLWLFQQRLIQVPVLFEAQ
jgi:hypothetical protein